MDRRVTATEANQNFSKLLGEVAKGESFTITSRNKPIAKIVPMTEEKTSAEAMKAWREYTRSLPRLHAGPWKREDLYD